MRFAPQTVEGVVTYETILSVDNSELLLRPGMTATAVITAQELKGVVLIPNSALRFTPAETKTAKRSGGGLLGAMFRRPSSNKRRPAIGVDEGRKVWVLRDGQPVAIAVKTGASDGKFTELRSGDIQPGQAVIVDALIVKK